MRWTIEPLTTTADLDALVAIEQASFTNPWTREMYVAELRNSGTSYFFVARGPDRRIVGFCAFWRVADELHVNNLAVVPEFRRQGVATELLEYALGEGRMLGARAAFLEVRRSNDPALQLYQRLGFSLTGIRRGYYTKPDEDALLLRRDFAPAVGIG